MISSRYWWFCGWKKISGPNLGHFRTKFGPKSGFSKYLDSDSFDLSDIAHSDWFQWYLTINGGFLYFPQNFGQNLGPFRPKICPRLGFWQILRLRLIRFVWYCFMFSCFHVNFCLFIFIILVLLFRWVHSLLTCFFLGIVHSERQLLGIPPGVPGHAKPPRTRLVTLWPDMSRGLSVEDT